MKKLVCLVLAAALILSLGMSNAFAVLNYKQTVGNEATFETLEEARVSGPAYLSDYYAKNPPTSPISPNGTTDPNTPIPRNYVSDPCLDGYPAGTTYIYRSADMYSSMSAAFRMNTNILVYTDAAFADKGAAEAYLKDLGLLDIINQARGSVVLVTPADPKAGFGKADQYAYYRLQSAMCNIGYSDRKTDPATYYADGAYYGGLTYRYVIGIGGGATFLNNYVSSSFDYVTRIAGMLLLGGDMQRVREVAGPVPVYLVNPSQTALEKYKIGNETDASGFLGDEVFYYKQHDELQKVYEKEDASLDLTNAAAIGTYVKDIYYRIFINALRVPVLESGLYTPSTLYSNYNWNSAPYSLGKRNPILPSDAQPVINDHKKGIGETKDGIFVYEAVDADPRFAAITTVPDEKGNTEYVRTWYEFLPEELVNGTAKQGTIPLLVAYHGLGDDPVQAVDELGILTLAGEERIAVVAPMHSAAHATLFESGPALARYMLETYPQLDPSRVYVCGYSYGGSATNRTIHGDASPFAAAVNMSGSPYKFESPEVQAKQAEQFKKIDIPMMLTTSTLDSATHFDAAAGHIAEDFQNNINYYLSYNEMPAVTFDFGKYPLNGFKGDTYWADKINDEYPSYNWAFLNDKGAPMVALSITEFLPHGLYEAFGRKVWNYVKHFSRNPETLEIVYNPYAQ